MTLARLLLVGFMLTVSSHARSAPIEDVAAWTQTFKQAALKTDTDSLVHFISDAAPTGFNPSALPGLFQSVKSLVGSQSADYAEEFDEKNVGTFLNKINIAVSYPKVFLFYSVILGRHADGWSLYSFKVDGNVNNILSMPWPGTQ